MTLRHMHIFVAVCEENSITNAAKKLYMSQPAVSLAIKELENYYDIKLFDRLSHKLYLTPMGKSVFNYALHITSLFKEMEESISHCNTKGKINIGTSITIGTCLIPGYIKQFMACYPHITPFVKINSSDIIEQLVLSNDIDFGLIEGIVHSEHIVSKKFAEDTLIVICHTTHALLKKNCITLDDLKTENFLMREKNSGTKEIIDSLLALHDFSIHPLWESTSTKAIIDAVSYGIGISILPFHLVKEALGADQISKLDIKDIEFKRHFSIIHHKDKYFTPPMLDFLKLLY